MHTYFDNTVYSSTYGVTHSGNAFLTYCFVTANGTSSFSFTIGSITMCLASGRTSLAACRAVFRSTSSRSWIRGVCVAPHKSPGIGSLSVNRYMYTTQRQAATLCGRGHWSTCSGVCQRCRSCYLVSLRFSKAKCTSLKEVCYPLNVWFHKRWSVIFDSAWCLNSCSYVFVT